MTTPTLLRCDWGRIIRLAGDSNPCPDRAVQRVVLHGGDPDTYTVQLCAPHFAKVEALTDPHDEGTGS